MLRFRKLSWGIALSVLLTASVTSAAVISVGYTGEVQGLDAGFAATLPPGSPIVIGAPVTINYSFESTTPDTDPSVTSGIYLGALTDFTIYIGGHVFDHQVGGPKNEIDVLAEAMLNIYQPVDSVISTPALTGFPTLEADVIFLAASTNPLPDDSLPISPPDPQDINWDSSEAAVYDNANTLLIDINLTTKCSGACAPPQAVPLGTAPWLALVLLIGGAGSLMRRTPRVERT